MVQVRLAGGELMAGEEPRSGGLQSYPEGEIPQMVWMQAWGGPASAGTGGSEPNYRAILQDVIRAVLGQDHIVCLDMIRNIEDCERREIVRKAVRSALIEDASWTPEQIDEMVAE
jgi:hypothetical protein